MAQWQARCLLYLTPEAAAEVVTTTYQSLPKVQATQRWSVIVFDEAHHLPAAMAIEAATTLTAPLRIALSATPIREDGEHDLIFLLGGVPLGADWPIAPVQQPRVTVRVVADDAAKRDEATRIAQTPSPGRTLIFVQRLAVGQQIAQRLGVPFLHGAFPGDPETLATAPLLVASSIADQGLSLPALRRTIELDFLYGSRMQAGQRVGRLSNRDADDGGLPGDHWVLMTRDEFRRYHKRLTIYAGWGIEVQVQVVDPGATSRG